MDGIASMSMHMSAAEFAVNYSVSLERKVMDTVELAAQEMLNMLPDVPRGEYIDTYA